MTATTKPRSGQRPGLTPCAVFCAIIFAAWTAPPLAAQYRGFSLGLGGEVNLVSLWDDKGYGAAFSAETRLNRWFSLAFQGNAGVRDQTEFSSILAGTAFAAVEASLWLRYYFLSPELMQRAGVETFVGAGGGVMATMNGSDLRNSRGSPEFGGIAGARFRLGSRFYLEPFIRGGYPFVGGAGLTLGFRFPAAVEPPPPPEPREIVEVERIIEVEKIVEVEKVIEVERVIEVESPLNETFVFLFGPNQTGFNALDRATLLKNEESLDRLLRLAQSNPAVRLLVEGYSNPVLGTAAERETLGTVSRGRVAYIAGRVTAQGIAAERLLQIGQSSFLIARQEDRDRWEKNRRVEVRLLQPLQTGTD